MWSRTLRTSLRWPLRGTCEVEARGQGALCPLAVLLISTAHSAALQIETWPTRYKTKHQVHVQG